MQQCSTFFDPHEVDHNRAIVQHEKLVRWVVGRQRWGGLAYADVLQVGRIGLWRALQRYDPERGTAFPAMRSRLLSGLSGGQWSWRAASRRRN